MMIGTPRMVACSAVASSVRPPVARSCAAAVSTRVRVDAHGPCRARPVIVEASATSSITFTGPPDVLTARTAIDRRPEIWIVSEARIATDGPGSGSADRVGTGVGVGLGAGVAVGDGDGLPDGEGEGEALGVGSGLVLGLGLGGGFALGLGVGTEL